MQGAIMVLVVCVVVIVSSTIHGDNGEAESATRVLSRRKRYLIFPDGSSFQLVFCTQNHGYLQIGDIVWFGNTAALAWELPTNPKLFHIFKNHEKGFEAENRNGVSKTIYLLDEDGKVLTKIPYHKRPIVNPAFAKRSVDEHINLKNKTMVIKEMHRTQKNTKIFHDMDNDSINIHREERNNFYTKVEKFLEGLGWRGRDCILRLICEAGRNQNEQGTFLNEVMRATFTLPRKEIHTAYSDYDTAHASEGECDMIYPNCEQKY